jgi:hypothetical protein
MFYIENRITNDLRISIAENNHVPIKQTNVNETNYSVRFCIDTCLDGKCSSFNSY